MLTDVVELKSDAMETARKEYSGSPSSVFAVSQPYHHCMKIIQDQSDSPKTASTFLLQVFGGLCPLNRPSDYVINTFMEVKSKT